MTTFSIIIAVYVLLKTRPGDLITATTSLKQDCGGKYHDW